MVQVAGGSNMMQGFRMEGTAESGFGVVLSGFHASVTEAGSKIQALHEKFPTARQIMAWEDNGYLSYLALCEERDTLLTAPRILCYRREPHKFFVDLPRVLASTRAQKILSLSLTGSLGSLSLVMLYRPAPEQSV